MIHSVKIPGPKANSACRYRLYPDTPQAQRLEAWCHTCRAVWNVALAQREWAYRSTRRIRLRALDQSADLTEARHEFDWLADLPAQSAQQVLRNLDQAYDNWWKHRGGPPRFKRRATARLSVSFPGQAVRVRRTGRRMAQVWLPKIGWVRFRMSRPLAGQLRNATVSRDGLGWHLAVGVHVAETVSPPANNRPSAGVDVGIACSIFVSTEETPRRRPDTLTRSEQRRLQRLEQRKARQLTFARKHNTGRYSNRLRRTIAAISSLRARQARRRADFNHKTTDDLAKNHGLIAIEDLRVAAMAASARGTKEKPGHNVSRKTGLNRAILDQGWYAVRFQLTYKVRRYGGQLITVPAAGTSQTCAACGVRDPASRRGCGRVFACVSCGHLAHADRNAASNILQRAMCTAGRAGTGVSGRHGSSSTRSPRGRGRHQASRLREPLHEPQ
jgi:putative transposase